MSITTTTTTAASLLLHFYRSWINFNTSRICKGTGNRNTENCLKMKKKLWKKSRKRREGMGLKTFYTRLLQDRHIKYETKLRIQKKKMERKLLQSQIKVEKEVWKRDVWHTLIDFLYHLPRRENIWYQGRIRSKTYFLPERERGTNRVRKQKVRGWICVCGREDQTEIAW